MSGESKWKKENQQPHGEEEKVALFPPPRGKGRFETDPSLESLSALTSGWRIPLCSTQEKGFVSLVFPIEKGRGG